MNQVISQGKFAGNQIAQYRLKVVEFHKKHRTSATIDAYGVSKPTIYRWKKLLKDSGGKLVSLIPKSKAPKTKRDMETQPKVVAFIRELRKKRKRIGKEKIKPLLDEYCAKEDLPTISESTIGKVISRHNMFYYTAKRIYHHPASKWASKKRNYKVKVKRSPKAKDFGYIEIDTIVKFIHGIKFYIFNAVDIKLKFNFAYGYSRMTSRNAKDFYKKLELVYPIKNGIKIVQTDNGSEYDGEFADYLKAKGIKHVYIYPHCPKINAFVERANRTLQEEFVDDNIELVLENIGEFNSALMDYLVWYNTKRVHKSLGNVTPIDYLLFSSPDSHMFVTYTQS